MNWLKKLFCKCEPVEAKPLIREGRRVGNTTRQVDEAIQTLFETGFWQAKDHWQEGGHPIANRHLFTRVLNRLRAEHPGASKASVIDPFRRTITIPV